MKYPKHLYEKIREEIAVSYVGHELKKLFPGIGAYELINLPEKISRRDFWNGVHGIGMGLKLHIGFVYLLTAENIIWTKEKIKTASLWFGVVRSDTKMVREGRISAGELIRYFEKHQEEIAGHKKSIGYYGNEDDPVICYEGEENQNKIIRIYEGNNRLYKAVLDKKETLTAYVGRYKTPDMKPHNYWLPTSVIMDNLYYVYEAVRTNNEAAFEAQIRTLKYMLQFSDSGRYEFENRALTTKTEMREKILAKIKQKKKTDSRNAKPE